MLASVCSFGNDRRRSKPSYGQRESSNVSFGIWSLRCYLSARNCRRASRHVRCDDAIARCTYKLLYCIRDLTGWNCVRNGHTLLDRPVPAAREFINCTTTFLIGSLLNLLQQLHARSVPDLYSIAYTDHIYIYIHVYSATYASHHRTILRATTSDDPFSDAYLLQGYKAAAWGCFASRIL